MDIKPSIMRPAAPSSKEFSDNLHHQTQTRNGRTGRDPQMSSKRELEAKFCVPDLKKAQNWDSSDGDSSDWDSSDGDSSDGDLPDEDSSDGDSSDGDSSDDESSDEDFSDEVDFYESDSNTNM